MCMRLQKYHCHVIIFNKFLDGVDGKEQSESLNHGQAGKRATLNLEGQCEI